MELIKDVQTEEISPKKYVTGRKIYMETYGCAMNFSDSEIVFSIMQKSGFESTTEPELADVLLINTCSIRENAEQKVRTRLHQFNSLKKKRPSIVVGVLGCMAERLKAQLLQEEKIVDLVAGPDAYRDLPNLLAEVDEGYKAVNVFLSREETYGDIEPVRLNTNGVNAYISIMRGCDNMCSFCVVPYTRGRERSRDWQSIIHEATDLFDKGYREVTLLGQNVDSYKWTNEKGEIEVNFAQLLEKVALVHPDLRIRFSTSHPKDITDEVLHTIKKYDNICNNIHLPAQSGSTKVLDEMKRTYTREWYMGRIDAIRAILGERCGISTDIITGFCNETEEDHQQTLSLMEYAKFDFGYMFSYSERPGTPAAKKYIDNVPEEVKSRRLTEIIMLQNKLSLERNLPDIGKVHRVLAEGFSKKSDKDLAGRNSENKTVIFPKMNFKKGDYVDVLVKDCTQATLFGESIN